MLGEQQTFTELQERQRSLILSLEKHSTCLEPSPDERSGWQRECNHVINQFIDQLPSATTLKQHNPGANFDTKVCEVLGDKDPLPGLLRVVAEGLSEAGILTAGPGHLGFVPGGGLYLGAIADHLAAAFNVFSADFYASPVAVTIHAQVIKWLCSIVGYDENAWGDITSGGSQATLTALYVAREACSIKSADYARTCVYLTEHTHHCCDKALKVLFGSELLIRRVPVLDYAMDPSQLQTMIIADQSQGLLPWLVIATAGTTNLGRVDPIAQIAKITREQGLFLHVDAACGGFFALCEETASLFAGINEADSVVLDPHKGLFLPYGCGAVLIRRGHLLKRAMAHTGSYLQDRDHNGDRSPMDFSLELTRPFRSLRIWLVQKIYGQNVFTQALREKWHLAQYCAGQLQQIAGICLLDPCDLSIIGFYYGEAQGRFTSEHITRELFSRINRHPEVFLSSTTIDGRFIIRIAILSFRTHLPTIEVLLQIIKQELANILLEGEGAK